MTIGLILPLGCLFVCGLLAVVYFSKKRLDNYENKIYKGLLVVNFVSLIMEFINTFFSIHYIPVLSGFVIKLYLLILTCYMLLLTLYLSYVSKDKLQIEKKWAKARISYFVFFAVFGLLMLSCNINIEMAKLGALATGPAVNLLSILSSLCPVAWIYNIIVTKNKENRKKFIPFIVYLTLSLFVTTIQFSNPGLLLVTPAETLVVMLMYFTIENPDVKMAEQLEIAKEQSDKANRAKTEFLSSMSHEIRTPLNAIVGFSDYIINAESLEEAKENAKDIVNASQTLLEIVNSILDISKIEAGKMEIVNTKYKAKETFESLAKLVTPKMNEKGLDFTYYIAPDIPNTLFGDAANIKKVVTNLLSNAYKYTEKGFVKYEVNCVNTNDLSKLIITVEDSGRGIKQDKIDKLFTKFQRLDEDKNTTIEGTGLGLAITKQLTELMGGKILVHTVYGQGSKFTIIITQKIETSVEAEPQETKQEVKKELDLTDKKILIVDDNELNLKVASKVLGKFNANKLTTITNGFECIDKIKANEKYDLILLDDMMPKMSGIETLKKLKEIANFNIPVVALTANAIAGMKEKYIKEGFSDYLAKPLEKDELIRVMNEFLFDYDKEPFEDTEILDIIEEELEEPIIQELSIPKESETQYLKEKGVDLEKALSLLEDMDTYNDTIKEFLSQAAEKWKKIKTYKENNDLENYEKEIQSLKRDAENLGFIDLEEYLARHELKANVKDPKYIETHFSELKKEYKKIIKIAEDYIELI